MRINKYVAAATGLSRRAADKAIAENRVKINNSPSDLGSKISENDIVTLDDEVIKLPEDTTTILFHKPVGYVCSRRGQGSETIYSILPSRYRKLKPIGRLDKDSSGLLLMSDDGDLAYTLTHPKYQKDKIYEVSLNKPLKQDHAQLITEKGVPLEDGPSTFSMTPLNNEALGWRITMREGRNRQIRRTFEALGYKIMTLHRTHFGDYEIGDLKKGDYKVVQNLTKSST
ncbi:MAG: pseudouridine synthase [Candidatus Saccharimonadales bacterium]